MSVTRLSVVVVLACIVAGLSVSTGCAGASQQTQTQIPPQTQPQTQTPARTARGSSNVLTQAQLAASNSDNLYDAITKVRPEWLSTRGAASVTDPTLVSPSVYMNGSMMGRVEFLKEVRILDVTEARYWNAGQASARFGMGHPRGVIELTRK
jgi:GDP-D-mannose dehydratase